MTLAGNAELGARWDVAVLGDSRADLNLGVTGASTMAADVCISVPIVSIGETSIPTSAEGRITLKTGEGNTVQLTRSETQSFNDALSQVAAELETVGLTMGGGLGDLWSGLDAGSVLSPDTNPLLNLVVT